MQYIVTYIYCSRWLIVMACWHKLQVYIKTLCDSGIPYRPRTRSVHTKVKNFTMEPCSQDGFASAYDPQFTSSNFGLQPFSVDISLPRYSFIACACVRMNELRMTCHVRTYLHYYFTKTEFWRYCVPEITRKRKKEYRALLLYLS